MKATLGGSPFPKSDAPARLLVFLAVALANGPTLVFDVMSFSGYTFSHQGYDGSYGVIALIGLLLLVLLALVFGITRSPTRGLAYRSLLVTVVFWFVSALILPVVT